LLSRTAPGARWACCIAGGLVLVSLSSDAWVHVFHPASGDVGVNRVAEQVRQHSRGSPSPLIAGLWIALAGPVAEELLGRGLIFNVLAQTRRWVAPRYSPALVLLAAVVSSLFFALWHGDAVDTLPDRFAMGMILCGVYWWSGSLLPAIAVHVAWNFCWYQVAVLGAQPSLLGMWPALDVPVVIGVLAALAVSGSVVRRQLASQRGSVDTYWAGGRCPRRPAGLRAGSRRRAARPPPHGERSSACASSSLEEGWRSAKHPRRGTTREGLPLRRCAMGC